MRDEREIYQRDRERVRGEERGEMVVVAGPGSWRRQAPAEGAEQTILTTAGQLGLTELQSVVKLYTPNHHQLSSQAWAWAGHTTVTPSQ